MWIIKIVDQYYHIIKYSPWVWHVLCNIGWDKTGTLVDQGVGIFHSSRTLGRLQMTEKLLYLVWTFLLLCHQITGQMLYNQVGLLGQVFFLTLQPININNLYLICNYPLSSIYLFAIGVGNVQAWRNGIVEDNVPITGCSYQTLQMLCFFYCVKFSPVSSMLAVIFRGVEIT